MNAKLSLEEVLQHLQEREAHHRDQEASHAKQEAFHAKQQVHHREQRALHQAELEKVRQSLETFRAASASAVELVAPLVKAAAAKTEPELPPPGRMFVSDLLRLVVESSELSEPFGPYAVAEEANRRFKAHLREPVGPRTASDVLRRLVKEGELQLVKKGKANHEALYRRRPAGGGE